MEYVIIRKALATDASGIATVHVKTWQCAYKGQIPNEYLDRLSIQEKTKTWKKQLMEVVEGKYTLVAEKEGSILGWCTAGKNRDEDESNEVGELYGIYVDPSYIGKGIGTKLMTNAEETLKNDGYKKATLWVLISNDKSRRFYEKKGWKLDGKTKVEKRQGFELHEIRYIKEL